MAEPEEKQEEEQEKTETIANLRIELEKLKTSLAEKEKISEDILIDYERRIREVEGILEAHFLQ